MSSSADLKSFFQLWELFEQAVLAGVFCGAMLGALGVYIVARRMVFLSATVAQMSSLGVALAFASSQVVPWFRSWEGVAAVMGGVGVAVWTIVSPLFSTPQLGALSMAIVTALLFVNRDRASSERMLGVLFVAGSATTLAVAPFIVEDMHDVQSLLFGTAVIVEEGDFRTLRAMCVVLLAMQLLFWRGFVAVGFDRLDARVRRLPVTAIELVLLVSLAIAVAVSTRVIGALPSFAFSILPAMAALRLAPNMQWGLVVGAILGAFSAFAGYICAFLYDLPVGASQAVIGVMIVALVELSGLAIAAPGWIRRRVRDRNTQP